MQTLKKRGIFGFFVWLVFGLALFLLRIVLPDIGANPFFFSLFVFFIIFLPGWLISRLIQFTIDDFSGQWLANFILGLTFYLLVNVLAILAGFDIEMLVKIILFSLSAIFTLSLILDLRRKNHDFTLPSIKIISYDSLYFLLPIFLGLFIIYVINYIGANLNGDPYLHLAVIRKAVSGLELNTANLALSASSNNLSYAYPVWHLFLAFLAKIFSLDIFVVWSKAIILLAIVSFFSWYYLSKMIFTKVSWAVLGGLFFMIFIFFSGPGYIFSRLSVPDTFCQFIVLPLAWAFLLKYIFEGSKKILIINLALALILLLIHGIHYLYFLLSIISFALLYLILAFRDKDLKLILARVLKVFLVVLAPMVLGVILFELHSQIVSKMLAEFSKASLSFGRLRFGQFRLFQLYSLILLPLTFLFLRQKGGQKRIIFLISLVLLTPLIYWTPLRFIFAKLFSIVFIERLQDNTNLYFLILATVGAGVLVLVNALANISQRVKRYFTVIIFLLSLTVILLQLNNHSANLAKEFFYSKEIEAFIRQNGSWLFILTIITTLVISGLIKYCRWLSIKYTENILLTFCLIFIMSFILFSPDINSARSILNLQSRQEGGSFFLGLTGNNQEAMDFINYKIPKQSVVLANSQASKALATLTVNQLAYSPETAYEDKFEWVFDQSKPDGPKSEIVTDSKWQIDYIYLNEPLRQNSHFKAHPEIYQLVYQDKTTEVYKIK